MKGASWNRRVWRLAGPIMLANITIPLLGAVDTAVVGHLDQVYYLGAVAIGSLIFNFLYWGFGFLRMGTTGFAAQAHGADDTAEAVDTLWRAMVIALIIGLALLITQSLIIEGAMVFMETSAEVNAHSRAYFTIRIWSAPAALANYVVLGWFLGMQNARAGVIIQIFINLLNIILDLAFVMGAGMAVEGVAIATVISEYAGLALGLMMIRGALAKLGRTAIDWRRVLEPARLRHMISVNRDIFLRTLCLITAFAYLTIQGARMGDVILAANAVLFNMVTFMSYALDGFANAAQALVGRAIGERSLADYRGVVRASTIWALVFAVGFSLIYAASGTLIIDGITTLEAVRIAAREALPWMVLAPLISVWGYQLDGIFIGAMLSREMRNAMILSLIIYLVSVEIFRPLLGNHGIWLGFSLFMVARGVTLGYYFPRIERGLMEKRQ
ncbi:MAG: MATE family efflux transporter [Alphaproteobacteria bacterium]